MEVVASLSEGRTAAAQCGLFTYKSVPVIFEPPSIKVKVNSSRYSPGVAKRVPGGLASQIFVTFGT